MNAVPLNKALFYFDLACLRDYGKTFTRDTYVALDNGPVVEDYQTRLIALLEKSGLAKQEADGDARPIRLLSQPVFKKLTPKIQDLAGKVSRWRSRKTSRELSNYSHENLGWIIAYRNARQPSGRAQVIDMHIAMQQILDDDPWMDDLDTGDIMRACEAADSRKGEFW